MKKGLLLTVLFFIPLVFVWTQSYNRDNNRIERTVQRTPVPIPLVGSEAPSFTAQSTNGQINFPADFGRNWKIIFAHPADFTPVCSSELLELAHEQESFDRLGTKLLVLSYDNLQTHKSWKAALEEIEYKGRDKVKIKFPLVADESYDISYKYGMVPLGEKVGPNIRSVFFIDPGNTVRAVIHYPNEVGRSTTELKRTLAALQTTYSQQDILTPANWTPGDDVMLKYVSESDREAEASGQSNLYQYSWFMMFRRSE